MTLPKVEVYQDNAKGERGLPSWTFKVDGQESLFWSPKETTLQRVINRLNKGRSHEAFGGSGIATAGPLSVTATAPGRSASGRGKVVTLGDVTTETVTTKSGRQKVKEKRPGFGFELDGKHYEKVQVASEAEAKALCAWEAFRTRGKFNPARFAEIQEQFKDRYNRDCKVHQVGRNVVVKDSEGLLWATAYAPETGYRFKQLGP